MFPPLGTLPWYWVSHVLNHLSKQQWELLPDIENNMCHCKASQIDFPSPNIKQCSYYDHRNPQTQLGYTRNLQVSLCFITQQNYFCIFKKRCHPNLFLSYLFFYSYFEAFMVPIIWRVQNVLLIHNINLSFNWINFNEHLLEPHRVMWEA